MPAYSLPRRLPYSHLNLRRNPFGVPKPEERADLVVANVSDIATQLLVPRTAIQLMGAHGRGKSSHLFALQRELTERTQTPVPYARLRHSPEVPVKPIVLLDEAALLYRRRWWRLAGVQSLAVSTHLDLRPLLWTLGFRVETLRIQGIQPQQLHDIFQRRLEWARGGPGPIPSIPSTTIDVLIEQFGDDVRSMEKVLYQYLQDMEEIGDVQMSH